MVKKGILASCCSKCGTFPASRQQGTGGGLDNTDALESELTVSDLFETDIAPSLLLSPIASPTSSTMVIPSFELAVEDETCISSLTM
jgi:hypothetical protein